MSVNVNVCDMHDNMHDSQREITAWVYVLILRREENLRSTGETNYNNSTHISSKFENQHGAIPRWSPIHSVVKITQKK